MASLTESCEEEGETLNFEEAPRGDRPSQGC